LQVPTKGWKHQKRTKV